MLEPLAYARVVERVGNEENVIDIDLEDVVPRTVQMTVSVSAATTDGQPLPPEDLGKVMQACALAQTLDRDRGKLQRFVGSRMSLVAPNLSAVCGAEVAAKLVGAAGGLVPLSTMPACNIQVRLLRHASLSTPSPVRTAVWVHRSCWMLRILDTALQPTGAEPLPRSLRSLTAAGVLRRCLGRESVSMRGSAAPTWVRTRGLCLAALW